MRSAWHSIKLVEIGNLERAIPSYRPTKFNAYNNVAIVVTGSCFPIRNMMTYPHTNNVKCRVSLCECLFVRWKLVT